VPFSNRPLYLQVRDTLAERIASGDLRPGVAIASEGELARQIGVSPGTVRKALEVMEGERLVVRRQGRGTFVSDPSSEERAARFTRLRGPNGAPISGQVGSMEVARGVATPMERARLRLPTDDEVYRIRRVRRDNGTNFLVEDIALPMELFPGLGERKDIPDQIGALAHENGILLGRAHERISTAVPPPEIAAVLGTAQAMPITVLDRVVFTIDDRRPVEWRLAHSHLPGSYYLSELR
jgi:GntR family transcriptional regulator